MLVASVLGLPKYTVHRFIPVGNEYVEVTKKDDPTFNITEYYIQDLIKVIYATLASWLQTNGFSVDLNQLQNDKPWICLLGI